MRTSTSIPIPQKIRDRIIEKANENIGNHKKARTGKWSIMEILQLELHQFIDQHKDHLPAEFSLRKSDKDFPSLKMISRAFSDSYNKASKPFRDLLAYYLEGGDWDELMKKEYPEEYDKYIPEKKELPVEVDKPVLNEELILKELQDLKRLFVNQNFKKELSILNQEIDQVGKKEERRNISEKIYIPSENDPLKPEFPPLPYFTPSFPASGTYRIEVPGFTNVWLKDESTNPTGTHKDRMAWEITILAMKYHIEEISLISSGSAALSIIRFFKWYDVNCKLKVLVDIHLDPAIKEKLLAEGCLIYETDLSKELFTSEQIKQLTDNTTGIDITYRETLDYHNKKYYDWMSYEILNENPEYCLVPFGTGDLFINILKIIQTEYSNRHLEHDPRFSGDIGILQKCHFQGATTHNHRSKLDKLFSYYLPSLNDYNGYIANLIKFRCIGEKSGIVEIKEKYVDAAIALATQQSIPHEPSGIAGLALLLQNASLIDPDHKILIVNTGKTKF